MSFKNSYFKPLAPGEMFLGQVEKIDTMFHTIKITIETDVSGNVGVFQSIDGVNYTLNSDDVLSIEFGSHFQVSVKGRYFYIRFRNGENPSPNFKLHTFLSTEIHNNFDVRLTSDDTITVIDNNTNSVPEINNQVSNIANLLNESKNDLVFSSAYVSLSSDGATLGADTNPPFTSHPTLKGWNYKNGPAGGASNLYFYSNPPVVGGLQRNPTVEDLKNMFVKLRILNLAGTASIPFVSIYTRPTGVGDAGTFYKSRITYGVNSDFLSIGEELAMVFEKQEQQSQNNLNPNVYRNVQRLQLNEILRVGEGAEDEELFLLSINTDSGAPVNTVDVVYSSVGYTINNRTLILELSNHKEDKNEAIIDALLSLGVKLDTLIESVNSAGSGGDGGGGGGGGDPEPGPGPGPGGGAPAP